MRKPIIIAIAAAVMAFGGLSARADQLQDGAAAFQNGNYGRALASWRPLAAQGNPTAQNNLGIMFLDGKGVSQNFHRPDKPKDDCLHTSNHRAAVVVYSWSLGSFVGGFCCTFILARSRIR